MKRHRSTQVKGHFRNLPPAYDEAVHAALLCDESTYDAMIGNQCVRALRVGLEQFRLEKAEFDAWIMREAA